LLSLSLILAACGPQTATPAGEGPAEETAPPAGEETEAAVQQEETEATTPEDANTPATEDAGEANELPPDPIPMTFQASDGVELSGTFYPSASNNAPLIVLIHWAPGDQTDWRVIAPWLQNRGLAVEAGAEPWLDASWFPGISDAYSFNVFTFTYRGCEGGCQGFVPEGWMLDTEAAMTHIIGIENVDLTKVLTIGASIGADGAAYGCHYYNSELGGCQGALSLSPGGYLGMPYADEVANLEAEMLPRPAWCLYADGDTESAAACQSASGDLYRATEYTDSAHGMALIEPDRDPNPMDLILDFIEQYLQCEACSI
jgi:pimeloyl-ACP methyl ester carboxylesterase